MTEKTLHPENRRQESRYYYSNVPGLVHWSWRKNQDSPWEKALLHDVSKTGVGLLIGKSELPDVGESFELHCKETGLQINCRIMHTEEWFEEDQIILGGKIVPKWEHRQPA